METSSPAEVVTLLRAKVLRNQVGLWRYPIALLGQEKNEAAKLMVEAVDLRRELLNSPGIGNRFVDLTPQRAFDLVDAVSQQKGIGGCALVYNLDLLLSGLTYQDREWVWQMVLNSLPHRPRAVLLSLPDTADRLFPSSDQLEQLAQVKLLA